MKLNEKFTVPALVTPFLSLAARLNLLPSPLLALPLLLSRKFWTTPPRLTVTGRPASDTPAPIVTFPFHCTVSCPVFLKLSLTVALFSVGGVMCGKFTTCASSCSLMHVMASDGSGMATRFSQVLLAWLLCPWTVTKVMTIAVPPGWIVGVYVKAACPTLLMPTFEAGVAPPVFCRT